jgi:hypothetical protein
MKKAVMQVELPGPNGGLVKGTVKASSIALSAKMQKISVELTFIREERRAIWAGSEKINGEYANAEMEGEGQETERFASASKARARLYSLIEKKDEKISELMIDQLKTCVNISKGDASEVPEVAWGEIDIEYLSEIVNFFLTGKKPSPTPVPGSEEAG